MEGKSVTEDQVYIESVTNMQQNITLSLGCEIQAFLTYTYIFLLAAHSVIFLGNTDILQDKRKSYLQMTFAVNYVKEGKGEATIQSSCPGNGGTGCIHGSDD